MFTTIQPHELNENNHLLGQIFKLRKKVFVDQLGWDVPVHGDQEYDTYDQLNANYVVWCSDDRKKLYGCVRLMPTTGPTLLHDVFGDTHSNNPDLIHEEVWEGTRMCVDEEFIRQDFPDMPSGKSFSLLFLALCEVALSHGIKRMVSNFEPCMSRIYRRAGLNYVLHGKAGGYGLRPVCCASFSANLETLVAMRKKIGVDLPLYLAPMTAKTMVATAAIETAA